MGTSDKKTTWNLKCAECGRQLISSDEEWKWARCRFCGKPVCFNCVRYMGTHVRGPFMEYLETMRTCNNCYVPRG